MSENIKVVESPKHFMVLDANQGASKRKAR
jgi:hypothetical protein